MFILAGVVLVVAPLLFLIYSNSVSDTSQCIASFEGQDSLPCRTGVSLKNGGTLTLSNFFIALSLVGLLVTAISLVKYFKKNTSS